MIDGYQDTLVEVYSFVGSSAGRNAISGALARRRLPGHFDVEIEQAVLGEALRFLKSGGTIGSPEGWCRARIAARAVDLSRGLLRDQRRFGRRVDLHDDLIGGITDETFGSPDECDAVGAAIDGMFADDAPGPGDADRRHLGSAGRLDGARRRLLAREEDSTATAGALTFVTLVGDGAEPVEHCPQPRAGATVEEAAIWAVLWYQGLRDCFGAGNTAAKRRSRAASRVRQLLISWAEQR